jgi:hypothetical protein
MFYSHEILSTKAPLGIIWCRGCLAEAADRTCAAAASPAVQKPPLFESHPQTRTHATPHTLF